VMQRWSDYISGKPDAKVVPINAAKRRGKR
jgi:hypothetical protein